MSKLRKISAFLSDKPWVGYVVVFLFSAVLYGAVQTHPSFSDPDSFYHAGMASLMLKQGTVRDFVWLPFTTLADSFADHHYLYHLLLLPFVWAFGPLAGIKVAAALFGSLAVVAFYLATRALRLRPDLSLVLAILLATSMNFMFRMNLAKAASLSVILLMLGVAAVVRRNWLALFALAFLYIWTHASWPLLGFIVGAFAVAELYRTKNWRGPIRMVGATALGLIAGLIINPYFPQNLNFYWYQTVHAAVLNYGDVINVGQEWYPYNLADLIPQNGAPLIVITISASLALIAWLWRQQVSLRGEEQTERRGTVVVLGVISFVFLVMAIRSQRHIEYFVPFGMLFAAMWLDFMIRRYNLRRLWSLSFGDKPWPIYCAVAFVGSVFPTLAIRDASMITIAFHDSARTFAWSQHEPAAGWMNNHLPANEVIYHGSWADFPALFFYAPQFRYIAGLDPTFSYLKDPAMFVTWREASAGRVRDISEVVEFYESKYVFVTESQDHLEAAIRADGNFRLVYEDDEANIFMLFP